MHSIAIYLDYSDTLLSSSFLFFFFSSRRRHTRCSRDWSSDVCSSDLQDLHFQSGRFSVSTATIEDRKADGGTAAGLQAGVRQICWWNPPDITRQRAEIGRASCRERV